MDPFRSSASFFPSDSSESNDDSNENKSPTFSSIQSPTFTSRIWDAPPKSMKSRISRLEKNREVSHKKKIFTRTTRRF